MLAALWWLLHPLAGKGYQFWSGIGSDFSELALLGGVLALLRKHNCHVKRCPRIAWHEHPGHGHPVCRKHHPDGDKGCPVDGRADVG